MGASIFARLGKRRVLPTSKKITRRSAMGLSYLSVGGGKRGIFLYWHREPKPLTAEFAKKGRGGREEKQRPNVTRAKKNCNMQSLGRAKALPGVDSARYGFNFNNPAIGLRAHHSRCALASQSVAGSVCDRGEPPAGRTPFQPPRRRLQHSVGCCVRV